MTKLKDLRWKNDMTLSKEYYDYEMSIVQTDPETGKLSLSHIPVDDPRLKKLQKLARSKRNKKPKNKELPKVVNITNRGKKFYDFEDGKLGCYQDE